jgi:hypothetical protein
MRRLKLWLAIGAALSLVGASAAVAWHKHGRTHTDVVTTSLNAPQVEIKNTTCTGEEGTYRQFHGKWTGTANTTGDPRLRGSLKVHASGLILTSTNTGQVTGWLKIRGERSSVKAQFAAVHNGTGQLNGFVAGWVHDRTGSTVEEQAGSGRLLGTLSGTLNPTTGALTASIGTGPVAPKANIQGGGCRGWHNKKRKGR